MAQLFHPATNHIAKATIFGALFILASLAWFAAEVSRSSYATETHVARTQPVPFSHEHHVAGLGIDCRYCHTTVENASFAGIPTTKTCMTCHSQIWTSAQILEPVRASWRDNRPIHWARVHDLPDFAYFDHSIHVQKGVGCSTCHGPVDQMPLTWKVSTLQMEWCLACHREPERYVRPREHVFNMDWRPPPDQLARGRELVKQYQIRTEQLTNCSICHR